MENTIAPLIERSNITSLRNAIAGNKRPNMLHEWTWYVDAPMAGEYRHDFQLYWMDFSTNERGKVQGEMGYEWLEVHEVGWHFNNKRNGLWYYVGLSDDDAGVAPNWSELKSVVAFALEDHYTKGVPQYWYDYSNWLAAYILFKTNPMRGLHKPENWV